MNLISRLRCINREEAVFGLRQVLKSLDDILKKLISSLFHAIFIASHTCFGLL